MSGPEPIWLEVDAVVQLHGDQLAQFGGLAGIRDAGMLSSALSRAKNLWAYSSPKPDVVRLAAAYAVGLAKNHPFIDGNKRVSLIACHMFLRVNRVRFIAPQSQTQAILDLAAGATDKEQFANWLRPRTMPLS